MSSKDLCYRYLAALNAGDIGAVLALFSADAMVVSPLHGSRDAVAFYTDLFADTQQSDTRFITLFDSADTPGTVALQFEYNWTLADGNKVSFHCVDVFEINPNGEQFDKLTIIYDTAPLRAEFNAATRTA